MKTFLLTLRNPGQRAMAAEIMAHNSPQEAMTDYLSKLPPPFNSYTHLGPKEGHSLHTPDDRQFQLAFGPFEATLTVEVLTAMGTAGGVVDAGDPA